MPRDQIIEEQVAPSASMKLPMPQPEQRRGGAVHSSIAGYTLVEVLLVSVIIGILAALAVPTYNAFIDKVKMARAKAEVRLLETEIIAYHFETGAFPANLTVINRQGLLDPWGHPYVYYKIVPPSADDPLARQRFGSNLNNDFDLCSKGADGVTEVSVAENSTGGDDLVRGADGAFLSLGADWAG